MVEHERCEFGNGNEVGVKKLLLVMVCAILVSGCGALFGRRGSEGIYPATRMDVEWMLNVPFPAPLLLALDLPISLAVDTVMLPHDVYYWWDGISFRSASESEL
ncbi:hypothetical protein FQZ97_948610 [compost metagenome]